MTAVNAPQTSLRASEHFALPETMRTLALW
jgi:hypothetical protein